MDADALTLQPFPLRVPAETPLIDAAHLMTGLDLPSIAVYDEEEPARTLHYEDVSRGLRVANEDTTVSELLAPSGSSTAGSPSGRGDVAATPDVPVADWCANVSPDIVLPSQFFENARKPLSGDPERRLMAAVLKLGLLDYERLATTEQAARREDWRSVSRWVEKRDTGWLYSFENACDVLGLDAEGVRERLRAFRDAASHGETQPGRSALPHRRVDRGSRIRVR